MRVDDFCAITCLFKPGGYRTKTDNFARFQAALAAQGVVRSINECAFGNAPFELAPGDRIRQIRARDVIWQKERLLNLALAALPARITKVAWLDDDRLFSNPRWAEEKCAPGALRGGPAVWFSRASPARSPGARGRWPALGGIRRGPCTRWHDARPRTLRSAWPLRFCLDGAARMPRWDRPV